MSGLHPSDSHAAEWDLTPAELAVLEEQVLDDPVLSRLAHDWMLGNSRSLADFLTYNRARIEARFGLDPANGTAGEMG